MKALSGAVVIAAGIACLIASAFVSHDDTGTFLGGCGLVVTVAGLSGWGYSLRSENL